MNFYIHQDKARGRTAFLLFLLAGAFAFLFALVQGLLFLVYKDRLNDPAYPTLAAGLTGLMILVVGGGSMVRTIQLSFGGGKLVAESMGGRLLQRSAIQDPRERRLLNIVEEMALASGIPVPPVYLIDEDGINAFAAGYSPSDAVIGVTRGCLKLLKRDELQGVIAHEFSHIFNGDMKLNIRLMGLVFGLLVLSLLGQILVRIILESRSGRSRSSSSGKDNTVAIILVLFLIGLTLWLLGLLGQGIARIIQAAISREREYLADASAVQFTRNPDGIAGALKKIGAFSGHGSIKRVETSEVNHMLFACGLGKAAMFSLDSHPPLPERIRRIDPQWDGTYPQIELEDDAQVEASEAANPPKDKGRDFLQKAIGYQILGSLEGPPTAAPAAGPAPTTALDAAAFACVVTRVDHLPDWQPLRNAVDQWTNKTRSLTSLQKSEYLAREAGYLRHLSEPQKTQLYQAIANSSSQVDLETACARQVVGLFLLTPGQRSQMTRGMNPFQSAVTVLAAVAHTTGMRGQDLSTAWSRAMTTLAKSAPPTGDPLALSPLPTLKDLAVLAECAEPMKKRFLLAASQLISFDNRWNDEERLLFHWLSAALDFQVTLDPEVLREPSRLAPVSS